MCVCSFGAPLQALRLPRPKPGPEDALLRVLACGVCYTDVKTTEGKLPHSAGLALPHVPGHEVCGEVVDAPAGSHLQVGQRVVVYNYLACGRCQLCRAGRENLCLDLAGAVGLTVGGGFQEFLAVRADRLLPAPDKLTNEEAAILSCAVGTSYHAVITRAAVRAGETVVVLGVGGVGIHALQVAKAAGARVIAVDADPRKLVAARKFCDGHVAVAGEAADRLVQELSGIGADAVVDTVGSTETLSSAIRLSRPGSRIVVVGYALGASTSLPGGALIVGERDFIGSRYCTQPELAHALAMVSAGQVVPVVDAVLPLEQANDALERLARGGVTGRLALRVAARGAPPS